ncbi:MAG: DMT family transporter, partial [Firmicutes bacterium]|nr:DMT family transporter [Bacillota bacterium]
MKVQQKADLALVLVAAFWGSTSFLTKMGLEDIEGFNLIALRFIIAFFLMAPLFWKRLKAANLIVVKHAAGLGAILFLNYILFTFGVKHTSVSNAGFLTCLAGVMVPVIGFFYLKQKPDIKTVFCVLLVFIGAYLLTFNGEIQFNLGDFLCILCSLAFALHIVTTGQLTR